MKRFALIALSLACLAGCEGLGRHDAYTGPVEIYRPPAGDEAARLTGTWGTFIDAVDGMPVKQDKEYVGLLGGGVGGNATAVAPGPRELRLFVTSNDNYYYTSFVYDFAPGHEYELCKALNVHEEKIRVHDKTTGDFRYVR